jgi:hypothetical protein
MYDGPMPPANGGVSVFEQGLERLFRKLPGRPVFRVDYPPHGGRPAEPPPVEESGGLDPLERRMASLAEPLETGADHLAVAPSTPTRHRSDGLGRCRTGQWIGRAP